MRAARKEEKGREAQRATLGLPEHIPLLPHDQEDIELARSQRFGPPAGAAGGSAEARRDRILKGGIFGGRAKAAALGPVPPDTKVVAPGGSRASLMQKAALLTKRGVKLGMSS